MAPFVQFAGRSSATAEVALPGFVGDIEQAVVVAFDGDGEAHGLFAEFDHVPDAGAMGGLGLVHEIEAGADEVFGLGGLALERWQEARRRFGTRGLAALEMEHMARDGGRGIAGEAAEASGPGIGAGGMVGQAGGSAKQLARFVEGIGMGVGNGPGRGRRRQAKE